MPMKVANAAIHLIAFVDQVLAVPEPMFIEELRLPIIRVPAPVLNPAPEKEIPSRNEEGLGARPLCQLRQDLLPLAREKDACGPEVYARASRYFLGAAVDLAEAYAWSWEEIGRASCRERVSNCV